MAAPLCSHLDQVKVTPPVPGAIEGCEDCLREGTEWVHLRACLTCGHIGCCDNSPRRHATAHFHATSHPLIASAEQGEDWSYCYLDDKTFILRFE